MVDSTRRHESTDAAYQGLWGRTRSVPVHVTSSGGEARVVSMPIVVNAATHPQLAVQAREGCLHRLEDGRVLAIPFIYHDPDARCFVLVVPAALAHQELALRAEWMRRLADDVQHAIAGYVRDVTTVVGTDALRAKAPAAADVPAVSLAEAVRGSIDSMRPAAAPQASRLEPAWAARGDAGWEQAAHVAEGEAVDVETVAAEDVEELALGGSPEAAASAEPWEPSEVPEALRMSRPSPSALGPQSHSAPPPLPGRPSLGIMATSQPHLDPTAVQHAGGDDEPGRRDP